MGGTAFLSVRVPENVRNRVKAIAAQRGERVQDLVNGLLERFLQEAEQRPPNLADIIGRLRAIETLLRAKGVVALFVFGTDPRLLMVREVRDRLTDILAAATDLRDFVDDMETQALHALPHADRMGYRAVKNALIELGEAAKAIPDDMRRRYPEVD